MTTAPKAMIARYAGVCSHCKVRFSAGTPILYSAGKARHNSDCSAAVDAPVSATVVSLAAIVAFMQGARDRGLQYPKAKFAAGNGDTVQLTLAGSRSRFPGSLNVLREARMTQQQILAWQCGSRSGGPEWIGRISVDGSVSHQLMGDADTIGVLTQIAMDPAKAAREYGALNACCSFCQSELSDAGSVEVGYGPVCAKRWGLPHHARGSSVTAAMAA